MEDKNRNIYIKPPLGLNPRWSHDLERVEEILAAMNRYTDANDPTPKEWIEELHDIVKPLFLKISKKE